MHQTAQGPIKIEGEACPACSSLKTGVELLFAVKECKHAESMRSEKAKDCDTR